ncbi:MAG: NAD-dependent epimerase/dehydratase family protein [Rhodocyclaceae bacterium]|nr:NAD-dependent epimerase/dehydratase family protein [Rhodocyclaceae bacterium]
MRALVTGGNGHLGYNLVKAQLDGGHQVRASVRSLADAAKTTPLRQLGAVELVEAELDRPDQLRAAMEGVDVLFHAAAVYSVAERSRDREILDASLKGAEAALRAAADARVGKVILTSSIVTLPMTAPGAPPSTEADWTTDLRIPYFRAKTEAEQLAWKLAGELKLNMATVLPGQIGGPGFRRNTPTLDQIEAMMSGAFRMGVPDLNMLYIDVRDVAAVHVLAAERDGQGRFIAVADEGPTWRRIMEVMHDIDPRVKPALMTLPGFMNPFLVYFDRVFAKVYGIPRTASPEVIGTVMGKRFNASNRRAREVLGWAPKFSLKDSLRDTMAAIHARRASGN